MKKAYTYCVFIFLLMCKMASAQINYTLKVNDVGCNHGYLGNAQIVVSETNPPYSYLWSTGAITPYVGNLEHGVYTVKVTDGSSNDTTVKIIIRELECEMIPEIVFTPNEDGFNDVWHIANAQYFPDALILVYNRWGQKVYEFNGLYNMPWDGKDMFGIPVPDASYYYVLYKDKKEKKALKKGGVSIVR